MRLTILHTNDIHGNVDGLARVATLVERIRSEADRPVLYVDAGDVEDTTNRLSSITKGSVMHRFLGAAGCQAAVVGNASWLRYGTQVLADHARAAPYPLLLANLRPVAGVRESVVLEAEDVRVGLIGVTAPFRDFTERFPYGVETIDPVPLVRRLAAGLRRDGAGLVVLLSHLGLTDPASSVDDQRLLACLDGDLDLVVGAHTHDALPHGRLISGVPVAQAGSYAEFLGRVDIDDEATRARLIRVEESVPPHPAVLDEVHAAERSVARYLDEVIGELPQALDVDAAARWLAEILRQRMGADVGVITTGQAFSGGLPAGRLRRGDLWDVCDSPANPGVTEMSGAELARLIARGNEPVVMQSRPRQLRGRQPGALHVAGVEHPDPKRTYRVAGTDWELAPLGGGLVDAEWRLNVRYDFPTIVREAIEEHLAAQGRHASG